MSERIVCKPSAWFIIRAVAMLAMFSTFAVLFFVDAKWGYREKNLAYMTHQGFKSAFAAFGQYGQSESSWAQFAKDKTIDLGTDPAVLPEGTPMPMPWPKQLTDYAKVKASTTNWKPLYDEFRADAKITREPDEHEFSQRKITEQWVIFGVSSALAVGTLFVLIRTMGRSMAVDDTTFYPASGAPVAISDLTRLDLRKWDTKGVAFAWAGEKGGAEPRKIRIDGFVYGGFKKEKGEPAEALMKRLQSSFSGEIVKYVTEEPAPAEIANPEA